MEPRSAVWGVRAPSFPRRELLLWSLAGAAAALALGSSVVVVWHALRTGDTRSLLSHQSLLPLVTLGFAALGALVASRRRHPVGWLLLAVGVLSGVTLLGVAGTVTGPAPALTPPRGWPAAFAWLELWLWVPTTFLPTTFVFLYFPDGRLRGTGWRAVGAAAWFGLAVTCLALMLHPGPVPFWSEARNPWGVPGTAAALEVAVNLGGALLVATLVASMVALAVQYAAAHGVRREQLRWMVVAAGVLLVNLAIGAVLTTAYPGQRLAAEGAMALTSLGVLAVAIAAAIAILRHRLYGLDVVLSRTLVYGSLSAAVLAAYLLVVGAVGAVTAPQGELAVALAATAVVAALVLPLRDRLQRGVNRLLYGQRDEPYEVLARLGRRLETAAAPDAVLHALVDTVAQTLRLPYVALALRLDGRDQTVAESGHASGSVIAFPLTHQGEPVGELRVAPRAGEATLSDAERPLLETIARQAGVAVHGVTLTRDLRRSRARLVSTREEERRRLRRDLHDGLGPALAAMSLKLDAARNHLGQDDASASTLLAQLGDQIDGAVADVRRLVDGLRPPALDELGLVDALREQARRYEGPALRIDVEAPEALPALPAAVEVAVFRIVQEALTNVVRHAEARHARVVLEPGERLCLSVIDDGRGLPHRPRPGVGLRSIRERAAELGGEADIGRHAPHGTRVRACLPLTEGG